MIDYQAIRFWIDIAILGWGFSVSGFVIWDRRNKVTQEAIAKFRGDVSAQVDSLRSDLDLRRRRVDEHIESMKTRPLRDAHTGSIFPGCMRRSADVSEIAKPAQRHGAVAAEHDPHDQPAFARQGETTMADSGINFAERVRQTIRLEILRCPGERARLHDDGWARCMRTWWACGLSCSHAALRTLLAGPRRSGDWWWGQTGGRREKRGFGWPP
jgi:hypothetical protein